MSADIEGIFLQFHVLTQQTVRMNCKCGCVSQLLQCAVWPAVAGSTKCIRMFLCVTWHRHWYTWFCMLLLAMQHIQQLCINCWFHAVLK